MKQPPYVIAITGCLATGKSTCAQIYKDHGFATINADSVAHDTYRVGSPIYKSLIEKFGTQILNDDKSINRQTLGRIVFQNPEFLKQLTNLVWPATLKLIKEEIEKFQREETVEAIFIEAAVLLEADWLKLADGVILMYVQDTDILKQRVVKRQSAPLSDEEFYKRLKCQLSYEYSISILKKSGIPYVAFCNNCSLEELKDRCLEVYNEIYNLITHSN